MRRFAPRRFTLLSAVSLLLFTAACAMWVRSLGRAEGVLLTYTRWPQAGQATDAYVYQAASFSGAVELRFDRTRFAPAYFGGLTRQAAAQFAASYPPGRRWELFGQALPPLPTTTPRLATMPNPAVPGFRANHTADPPNRSGRTERWFLAVPYWAVMAATLLLPALWLNGWRKRRRVRGEGCCADCGYDLRATPGRCPECGRVAA